MQFKIEVSGATPDEVAKGLAAAQAIFDKADVTPDEAATARFNVEGWDIRGVKGHVSDFDLEHCKVWFEADAAAVLACCRDWPEEKKPDTANLELVDLNRRPFVQTWVHWSEQHE